MVNFFLDVVPFLVPLLLLSVYSLALILEKRSVLRKSRALNDESFSQLLTLLRQNRSEGVLDLLPKGHPFRSLWNAMEDLQSRSEDERAAELQSLAQFELSKVEDRISYFPALANVATLLGLFGTVCGMILSFLTLRSGGGADPSALAAGIAQALFATAFGLVTAIPSLTAHALFQKKIQSLALQLESLILSLTLFRGTFDASQAD